jgi:hypothetical protein
MAMRDVRNPQPVSAAFLQELERHRPPVVWDGKTQFGVRRNREGDALNAACAARFAEMHNVCLVRWRLPVTGLGHKDFSAEALEVLYKNEPGLWGYFVVGAPALYVNMHVSTVCGVVNGADLAIVLSAWGQAGPVGDVNGDGTVNGSDLAIVLGSWS